MTDPLAPKVIMWSKRRDRASYQPAKQRPCPALHHSCPSAASKQLPPVAQSPKSSQAQNPPAQKPCSAFYCFFRTVSQAVSPQNTSAALAILHTPCSLQPTIEGTRMCNPAGSSRSIQTLATPGRLAAAASCAGLPRRRSNTNDARGPGNCNAQHQLMMHPCTWACMAVSCGRALDCTSTSTTASSHLLGQLDTSCSNGNASYASGPVRAGRLSRQSSYGLADTRCALVPPPPAIHSPHAFMWFAQLTPLSVP